METASPPCPLDHVSNPLTLGAIPSSPGTARAVARSLLIEWGLADLADTAELVVSELVTNAVQVSACYEVPSPVQFRMSASRSRVLIEVWDCDPRQPIVRQPMGFDESGRGLLLVATLSAQWGWTEFKRGKIVWAEIEA
jgi:anti-sigma regulatory factor (Ser/Thr protein kinase)